MPLVSEEEVSSVLRKGGLGVLSHSLSRPVMRLLKIDFLNTLYDRYSHLDACGFIDAILQDLDVHVDVSAHDIKKLAAKGPKIVIANHPLGLMDGLVILRILLTHRQDVKVMSNFLLKRIDPLNPFFCPVNPFENQKHLYSSLAGFKEAIHHLRQGGILVVFPAGQVSTHARRFSGTIADKQWEIPVIKLIQKAKVDVCPVFLDARNSPLFYTLSAVHPALRTAALPGELLRSKGMRIRVKVGNELSVEEQNKCTDTHAFCAFLRSETYTLENSEKSRTLLQIIEKKGLPLPVALEKPKYRICQEIARLDEMQCRLFTSGKYAVYFSKLTKENALMQELGRLRELTFREVGEGTLKQIDLDQYDQVYNHLILWDEELQQIAGAYRLGIGADIWKSQGMAGFYLSTLFQMRGPVTHLFQHGIEMGRAFVSPFYQGRPMPLFLLWKGIAEVAFRHPGCNYLIGAVSISNRFSKLSQSLLVEYLQNHHLDEDLADFVQARNPFTFAQEFQSQKAKLDSLKTLPELDKCIRQVEMTGMGIPVLIKKYIEQNATLLGFNVDKEFNNAIDGLMYLDLEKFDAAFLKR